MTGEGEAAIAPDMAWLSLSVLRDADTAGDAMAQARAATADVIAALKAAGIEGRDLQTSNLNIEPRYVYPQNQDGSQQQPKLVGYRVTNSLMVRVRDLKKLGTILDTSVKLGINQGGDITFTNDKPEATVTEARKLAVADALAKAKTLTEAAGVKLGRVIQISENSQRPMPVPAGMMRASMMKEADSVPIASGENNYSVVVNVTFALEQ